MIHTGDCLEVMAGMEAESVDAVVTDPPYGLGFMGKAWDNVAAIASRPPSADETDARFNNAYPRTGKGPAAVAFDGGGFQAWCEAWGREALRVTKPGGYLLAFGGTRTHHRLVCGLEDAGWIIRDELTWVYASGFPKGKANLKPAHEPIVLARKPGPLRPLGIDAGRIGTDGGGTNCSDFPEPCGGHPAANGSLGGGVMRHALPALASSIGRWPSNLLLSDPALFDEPNPEVVGSGAEPHGAGFARTGGADTHPDDPGMFGLGGHETNGTRYGDSGGYSRFFKIPGDTVDLCPNGHLLAHHPAGAWEGYCGYSPDCEQCREDVGEPDHPSAFIIPKAGRSDREPVLRPDGHEKGKRFTSHPTVKPVSLMRHLIRLVTPIGGVLLDPFAGSGSTGVAATLEGFDFILIEKEPEYVQQIEARLNGTQRGLGLDVPAPTKQGFHLAGNKSPIRRRASGFIEERGTQGRWPDEEPAA